MSMSTKALTLAILVGFIAGCSFIENTGTSADQAAAVQTTEEATTSDGVSQSAENINNIEGTESATATGEGLEQNQIASTSIESGNEVTATNPSVADSNESTVTESEPTTVASSDNAAAIDSTSGTSTELASNTDASSNEQTPAANSDSAIRLNSIRFSRSAGSAGEVEIALNSEAAYVFEQSADNEYVLRIPGVEVAEDARTAQLSPPGFPGIRAVRVGDSRTDAEIRMFVDNGTRLNATSRGSLLMISANNPVAREPESRGQLAKSDEKKEKAVKDKAADTKKAEEVAKENPTGLRSADGSKVYTGRLISLDLQDTDIDNALRIIAEVSQLNIIASEDVKGKVTLRLIDVPWDQALDVILKTNGLDQVQEGNVIRIAPVDKLRAEREALLEAKQAAEALEDLQVKYIRVSYARATDVQEQVQSVLSERGSVATDERTNQLIIKDIEKGQVAASELLKKLDLRTPQILLETQIVEATKGLVRSLGFQWNYNIAMSPDYGNATGLNFPNSVNIGGSRGDAQGNLWAASFPATTDAIAGSAISAVLDSADGARSLSARLSAYENEGLVKVISRPQVATVNNKEAKIESAEVMRVKLPDSGVSIATGQGAAASSSGSKATEEIKVGIELTVTPQASPDYYVLLDLHAKSATFGADKVEGIPNTIERSATSTVLVKSGQTFALGGVYRIQDSDIVRGIPFLKDIPFLGHLFRSSDIDKSDQELIFFITPHIVEGSFEKGAM